MSMILIETNTDNKHRIKRAKSRLEEKTKITKASATSYMEYLAEYRGFSHLTIL